MKTNFKPKYDDLNCALALFNDRGLQYEISLKWTDFNALLKLAERVVSYNLEHDKMATGYLTEDTKELIRFVDRIKEQL